MNRERSPMKHDNSKILLFQKAGLQFISECERNGFSKMVSKQSGANAIPEGGGLGVAELGSEGWQQLI